MKVRLSKKFVLILGGGLAVCGASGAAAVLVGTDKILGPSYREINGLACTTLQTIKVRNDRSTWVRKYVTSDETGDGLTRVKTALRVARAVQEKEKVDLVQVAVIDKSGPKERAAMRGRMVGAQVVYIPDLAKVPEGAEALSYSAYYLDGTPMPDGQFYGMRIDLPLEEVEHLEASLTDKADCTDPAAAAAESAHGGGAAKGGGHGEAPGGHGAAKPSGHGEAAGHEAPAEHGAAPAEGHEAVPAGSHGEEASTQESGGLLSSLSGMIFGSKEEPAAGHAAQTDADAEAHPGDHEASAAVSGAAVRTDHAGKATTSHAASSTADAGEKQVPEGHDGKVGNTASGEDHGEQSASPAKAVSAEMPNEEKGFFDQVKGMIFGDPAEASHQEAKADAGHGAERAEEAAREPRTSAEGGKRWSNADQTDEIHAAEGSDGHPATTAEEISGKPAETGANEADAAGAAWLEQFRAQQAGPTADGAKH